MRSSPLQRILFEHAVWRSFSTFLDCMDDFFHHNWQRQGKTYFSNTTHRHDKALGAAREGLISRNPSHEWKFFEHGVSTTEPPWSKFLLWRSPRRRFRRRTDDDGKHRKLECGYVCTDCWYPLHLDVISQTLHKLLYFELSSRHSWRLCTHTFVSHMQIIEILWRRILLSNIATLLFLYFIPRLQKGITEMFLSGVLKMWHHSL